MGSMWSCWRRRVGMIVTIWDKYKCHNYASIRSVQDKMAPMGKNPKQSPYTDQGLKLNICLNYYQASLGQYYFTENNTFISDLRILNSGFHQYRNRRKRSAQRSTLVYLPNKIQPVKTKFFTI